MRKVAIKKVELEPLVASLASRVDAKISKKAYFSLTRKFYHKSGNELRLEREQKIKLAV